MPFDAASHIFEDLFLQIGKAYEKVGAQTDDLTDVEIDAALSLFLG